MNRSALFALVGLVALSSIGCMSVRDRVAMRLGLPTKYEKDMMYLARYRAQKQQTGGEGQMLWMGERPMVVMVEEEDSPRFFRSRSYELQKPDPAKLASVVVSPKYPELSKPVPMMEQPILVQAPKSIEHPKFVEQPKFIEHQKFSGAPKAPAPAKPALDRYVLEKEAARLRWEASLMKLQADQVRNQIALLDNQWLDMSSRVAVLEQERGKLRDQMAKLEVDIEKAKMEAAELEATWSRFASR